MERIAASSRLSSVKCHRQAGKHAKANTIRAHFNCQGEKAELKESKVVKGGRCGGEEVSAATPYGQMEIAVKYELPISVWNCCSSNNVRKNKGNKQR